MQTDHFWEVPIQRRNLRAILWCRLQCSTASAAMIPPVHRQTSFMHCLFRVEYGQNSDGDIPMNIMVLSLMYNLHTSEVPRIPRSGNRKTGMREVIAMGTASVIQNATMMMTAYAHLPSICKSNSCVHEWFSGIAEIKSFC